ISTEAQFNIRLGLLSAILAGMRRFLKLMLRITLAVGPTLAFAQIVTPLTDSYPESTLNQKLHKLHSQLKSEKSALSSAPSPRTVVFIGDRVIPQFVDGGSWQTSITVINLENHATSFDVLFFNDNGTDLVVPVVGQGSVRGMHIPLGIASSATFETTGTENNLSAGWAVLSQSNNDSVGIFAVFRQTVPGGQAQEAVVPAVNQFENHFVLPYDNTKYVTGIALANPTPNSVIIPVNIRNESGQIIDTRQITLGPFSHTA